jgi:hypothetical protein
MSGYGSWLAICPVPICHAEDIKSPRDALDAYIWHRSQWVDGILAGRTLTEEVMPANVDPTREMAEVLSSRLKTLNEEVLPHFRS